MQQTFHEQKLVNTGFMPRDTVLFQKSAGVGLILSTVLKTKVNNKLTNSSVALSILVLIMQLFSN
ncbi:MAG: hypothetical protein A3I68_04270 [Candidatus Melainabacteria bacterium RIFCSPLOWO2_02_FULL_35_15]|nr:MAG: hypothetical protein A3F80_06290 [Candidatus Melainabacteria bacterium RIFCSPLOWO2_12_FULL_35_11]OGI14472.1 MAG: hypothetical protein A3I68_04270 [Candidatus Melainabacteria bacterium RIFCSPLOWO2_02_FULL_35_15]